MDGRMVVWCGVWVTTVDYALVQFTFFLFNRTESQHEDGNNNEAKRNLPT